MFDGPVTIEENRTMLDLELRERLMLAPVLALIVFIGVYPKPFLERIEPAAERIAFHLRCGHGRSQL